MGRAGDQYCCVRQHTTAWLPVAAGHGSWIARSPRVLGYPSSSQGRCNVNSAEMSQWAGKHRISSIHLQLQESQCGCSLPGQNSKVRACGNHRCREPHDLPVSVLAAEPHSCCTAPSSRVFSRRSAGPDSCCAVPDSAKQRTVQGHAESTCAGACHFGASTESTGHPHLCGFDEVGHFSW